MKNARHGLSWFVVLALAVLLSGSALIACAGGAGSPEAADLVLLGGRVYTFAWPDPDVDGTPSPDAPLDPEGWHPDAEAVAVRGGRILAVGSDADIRALAGESTRVIDLAGATVLPGLIESHAHAAELGRNLLRVDLVGAMTQQDAVARVAAAATDRPAGEWVLGWGFDDGAWADSYPDNELLSQATPNRPVLLSGLHGFAVWANDEALRRAGIDAATPDPEGGRILRHADGRPTGMLLDRAARLMDTAIPAATPAQTEANLQAGLEELARSGYVAVHEAGAAADLVAAMTSLELRHLLPVRLYAMLSARDAALAAEWAARGPLVPADDDARLTVRSVKAYYDAALGSRGARLLADYSDLPGHRGTAGDEYGFDEQVVIDLMRAGFQVGIHAIGDAGNRETLDFLERVLNDYPGTRTGRHRIEHAQVLHPDDLPRLAALGITASMEPPHAVEDMTWAEDRIGAVRLRGAYAWRSLRRAGTALIFNSDLPGSDHSFFYGLHAAVTRRDKSMQPEGGWHPEETLTPEETLRAYTVWAARSAFQESQSGTLEPGKWADITVLRPDPLALPLERYGEVLDGHIEATIVGGRVAFER